MEITSGNPVSPPEVIGSKATTGAGSTLEGGSSGAGDPFAALLALLGPPPAASLQAGSSDRPTAGAGANGPEAEAASGTATGASGATVPGLLGGLLGGPLVATTGTPGVPVVADPTFLAASLANASRNGRARLQPSAGTAAPPTGPDPRPIGGIPGGLGTTAPGAESAEGGKPTLPGPTTANTAPSPPGPISDPSPTPSGDGRHPTTGTSASFGPGGRPIVAAGWLGVSAPGDAAGRPGRPPIISPAPVPEGGTDRGGPLPGAEAPAPTAPAAASAAPPDPAAASNAPPAPVAADPAAALAAGLPAGPAGPSGVPDGPAGLPTGLLDSARTGDAAEASGSRYAAEPAHIRAQVIRQLAAENAAPGQSRNLTLRLEPGHLGKVEVQITATDDGLEVVFRAETAAAQDALRDRSGELARALGAADARWQKVEIKVSEPAGSRSDPEEADEDGSEDQPRRDQQESRDRRHGDDR